jgi:hypothetical protein
VDADGLKSGNELVIRLAAVAGRLAWSNKAPVEYPGNDLLEFLEEFSSSSVSNSSRLAQAAAAVMDAARPS